MLEELKKKFKERDRALSVLSKDGSFRASIVRNTYTAVIAQEKHNLSHIPAFYLAKTLTAATMISIFLKGEERIMIDFAGDGILKKIYAEVLHLGECRGFVEVTEDKKIDSLSEILGTGTLTVKRILYNQFEPIVGIVPIQKGDITSDLEYYFSQSEQIDTGIILDAKMDDNGILISSGGLMVQAMPGTKKETINDIINSINNTTSSICNELEQNHSLEHILIKLLPFEFHKLKSNQIDFYCRCSAENFKDKLQLLDVKDIQEMKKSGQNELVCQFCNKHYYLTDADFGMLIYQSSKRTK